jgi:hypothetical protein
VRPDHCRLETAAGEATSEDVAGSGQEAVDRPFRQPYRRNPPVAVAREAPVARSASARADDAAASTSAPGGLPCIALRRWRGGASEKLEGREQISPEKKSDGPTITEP